MNFPDFLKSIKAFRISSMVAIPELRFVKSRKIPLTEGFAAALSRLSSTSFKPIGVSLSPSKPKDEKGLSLLRSGIGAAKVRWRIELSLISTLSESEPAETRITIKRKNSIKLRNRPSMEAKTILKKLFIAIKS